MQRYGTAVPLGSGSFADVYRCFDAELRRPVALKLLRWNEPGPVERLFREARAQARVDHEGVCKVYDTGHHDGRPFIAMEFVDGVDLATAARDLPLRCRLRLMVQVAEAVQAAHESGLVHRDLKPENVLVTTEADGRLRPVVVDFGLVYDVSAPSGRMTRDGEPLGTPAFMSPEQAAGHRDRIDARTDVYGLGATLYTLLTGKTPFDGDGTTEQLIKALEAEPVRPRRRNPTLPAEVERIVLKCLEKNRDRRYGSARELADDLNRFLDGEPVRAGRATSTRAFGRRLRRHRQVATMVAVGVGIAGMALWSVEQQAREASRRAADEQRFVQAGNDLDWGLRAAQMSSPHDITPSRERVRERIHELERDLERLDPEARGPAHYAVGRAYAALRRDGVARRHLESAWTLGHRTPEVGYFLGLVLGRQYEDALERVRHVSEAELRRIYVDDAVARFREPAKAYLEVGREAEAVSVEYVEALIDFYEERFPEALEKLADVRRRLPWLYEASIAEGKVLRRMADERFAESEIEAALELYGRAQEALRRAMASASSDPQVYPELCRLSSLKIEADLDWSIAADDEAWQEHLEICDRGLSVDPLSARAHRASALAYELRARLSVDRSWHPERARLAIERAQTLAEEAVRLRPREADGHAVLARILMTRGRLTSWIGGDEDLLHTFRAAGRSLERAVERTVGPKDALRLQMATNHQLIAAVQSRRWRPADAELERALELIYGELDRAPRSFTLQCEAGHAELALALEQRRLGRPSDAALERSERAYGACLELNEKYHWAHIGLAEVLSARSLAECVAGRFDRDLPRRARERLEQVTELDPSFASADLRRATYWAGEALCTLMKKRDPGVALDTMTRLAAEAREDGPRMPFIEALSRSLELRRGLLLATDGARSRRDLEAALERSIAPDAEVDEDASISLRFYRIDELLWAAEAAWELGRPSGEVLARVESHLERLAAIDDGAITETPQFKVQELGLRRMQRRQTRGVVFETERRACAEGLRRQMEAQPFMAPHVVPWLHRLQG